MKIKNKKEKGERSGGKEVDNEYIPPCSGGGYIM
jgi:hypothetical protein